MRVDRRLWATRDGRLVDEGDPDAYQLMAIPGDDVPDERLAAYGGLPGKGKGRAKRKGRGRAKRKDTEASDA